METLNRLLSEKFSSGNFTTVYAFFSDDIEWNLIGNQILKGKVAVRDFCAKMLIEIASCVFINHSIIETLDKIVIEGKCRYVDTDGKECIVHYCDIYRFENDKVKKITSYCI